MIDYKNVISGLIVDETSIHKLVTIKPKDPASPARLESFQIGRNTKERPFGEYLKGQYRKYRWLVDEL